MHPSLPPEPIAERTTLPGRAPRALPPLALDASPPTSAKASLRVGFAMALARLRGRPVAVVALLAVGLATVGALVERSSAPYHAVDRALRETMGLVVPIAALLVAGLVTGRARLQDAVWPAARFGARRRDVALGVVAGGAVAAALVSAAAALVTVLVAGGPLTGALAHDALLCAWIGAVASFAYAGWFFLGSTFLRAGAGRLVPFVADVLLGASTGLFGLFLPRGHVEGLLGGAAPLDLSQSASTAALLAMGALLGAGAALRCGD